MSGDENRRRSSDLLLRNLFKERRHHVMSNYVAPTRNSHGVVSELVNKIEYRSRSRGHVVVPPLAEVEEEFREEKHQQQQKVDRKKYKGAAGALTAILDKAAASAAATEEGKENPPKASKVGDYLPGPCRLKRTLTDSTNNNTWRDIVTSSLGGPLKKRLSEGAATLSTETLHKMSEAINGGGRRRRGGGDSEKKEKKEKTAGASSTSFFGTLIRLSSSSSSLKELVFGETTEKKKAIKKKHQQIVGRAHTSEAVLEKVSDRPKIEVDEKKPPPPSPPASQIERLRPFTIAGSSGNSSRSERRLIKSRTMSLIPTSPTLPPLYEEECCSSSTMAMVSKNTDDEEDLKKKLRRQLRRYGGSHTTSTYQGKKDAAPDASPRRHLIGFLHRTSHLSLTSELSGTASFYLIGHRRHVEESTIGSESDARVFSDEDDRGSTTTDFTSVSRQHEKMAAKKKKNRKNFRKPSRASSFSSITESSMSLDVITVTLNMDTVNFLGISIVGQTSTRGDNGIYVANIMKGGAVALDGRIEAGDMILQVNDISFENFTNDQAVDVLRDAVGRRGPIKLTVAKSFENGPQSCFTIPRNSREEPVRPIDTQAWIQHTNAMRGMPSIIEESAPTPIPGDWPHGRPQSSSTVTSNGSNGQNTVVGGGGVGGANGSQHIHLDIHTDKKKVVEVMAMPSSGLDIKNRTWLKIPIPMSFLGSDLVEWLLDHVDGLRERKDARKYAAELLKLKYIAHVVNKITFTEQCYYVLGDECAEYTRFRNEDGGPKYQWAMNGAGGGMLPPPSAMSGGSQQQQQQYGVTKGMAPSMVSGYASMPVSPFPMMMASAGVKRDDQRSQASGSSGGSSRLRNVILPNKPSGSGSLPPPPMEDYPDMAVSRQSFRAAMNHPCEFLIDNI